MLVTDREFQAIIPPLQPEESAALEASIKQHGCRDPLIIWAGHDVIIDGHNRHEICTRLGLPYTTWEERRERAIAQADLRGIRYNNQKKMHGGDRRSSSQSENLKTADKVADETGVSKATVLRDAKFSESLDAIQDAGIARSEFTSGSRKVDRGSILKLGELAKTSPADAKAAWDKVNDKSRPENASIKTAIREVRDEKVVVAITKKADELVQVHHGDFYNLSADIPDGSIDAIITDPPYPKEYLHTWNQMAEVAMRVLKPGGWCIAYSGKLHLDDVMARVTGSGLSFYWQLIFKQTVQAPIHPRKVNTLYKPILVFQKPPITPQESYIFDVIEGEGVQKDRHEWQQSEGGFEYLINAFTMPGDTILEPFAGGGTVPAVAKRMNRYCIAYEIDEKSHAQTCDRLWGTAS
jgi:SAM-dependent methyltransferase